MSHSRLVAALVTALMTALVFAPVIARAQERASAGRTASALRWVGGAATALVAHESGHLAANAAFGANVSFKRVEFQGIPFFAVMHSATVTPREEFVISSAGFWVQHASNEWLLTRHPALHHEHRPFMKGAFAFNTLLSVGYAGAAFTETGPAERDPRSMAVSLRVREPVVGALILAPALLDTWRYYHPGHAALTWTSRSVKVGMLLLAARPHGS